MVLPRRRVTVTVHEPIETAGVPREAVRDFATTSATSWPAAPREPVTGNR